MKKDDNELFLMKENNKQILILKKQYYAINLDNKLPKKAKSL